MIGLALAIALVDAGWHLAARWFPPPPMLYDGFGVVDEGPSIVKMPMAGMVIIALGWFLAGLIGAFAALRIGQWRPAGWIVASLIVMANLWMASVVAAPIWLLAAAAIAPLVGCWLAERHFHRARRGDPLIN